VKVSQATSGQKHARPRSNRKVLMSPFTNTTNPYIGMQKQLLGALGFDVRPLSLRGLLSGGFLQLLDRRNVLVFHWLELRLFKRRHGGVVLSALGCFVFAFYILLIGLSRARVVYFVHDHVVHDSTGRVRRIALLAMAFLRRLADFRVVHAPDFEATYRADYLPHPLYWDVPGRPAAPPRDIQATPRFAMLGTIRPYKDLAAVLQAWPSAHSLRIAGRGDDEYVQTLREIVAKRELGTDVMIEARFLSDAEFDAYIASADVLILPHVADSMLVSGAFFEAIGRVPLLIARATPFMTWAAARFDNILLFETMEQLAGHVCAVSATWQPETSVATEAKAAVSASGVDAVNEFGWQACCRAYGSFFDDVLDDRDVPHPTGSPCVSRSSSTK
jgi:beta-1,4-mannosyltransferase